MWWYFFLISSTFQSRFSWSRVVPQSKKSHQKINENIYIYMYIYIINAYESQTFFICVIIVKGQSNLFVGRQNVSLMVNLSVLYHKNKSFIFIIFFNFLPFDLLWDGNGIFLAPSRIHMNYYLIVYYIYLYIRVSIKIKIVAWHNMRYIIIPNQI